MADPSPPKIIAYVRTPSKIPADLAQKIQIVQGGLRDESALDKALQGADVLVSFLGPSEVSFKAAIARDFSAIRPVLRQPASVDNSNVEIRCPLPA